MAELRLEDDTALQARLLVGADGRDSWVRETAGSNATERPVFVRADGAAPYQAVARVMARLSSSGFTKMNLITDTAATAPSTGGEDAG